MDPLREPEEEPASKNTTEVEMNQIVTSEYVGETGARFYGVLLKWMDICSCVSGSSPRGRAPFDDVVRSMVPQLNDTRKWPASPLPWTT